MQKLLIAAFLTTHTLLQAQVTTLGDWDKWDASAVTQDRRHTTLAGDSVPYRLFLPDNFDPAQQYPLVLVLHGNGSRGTDNTLQLIESYTGWMQPAVQDVYPSIIIVPQMNGDWAPGPFSGNTFYETPTNEWMRALDELMARFYEKDFVERSRVYVYGTSKGGAGTWDFTMRNADIVAAAMPMMGWGDPSQANLLQDIPIWASHGVQDTIVPTSSSVNMINAVATGAGVTAGLPVDANPAPVTGESDERLDYFFDGNQIRLSLYPAQGHGSAALSWQDPDMINWTFAQTKPVLTRPLNSNSAPVFDSNPAVLPNAIIDQSFTADLLDYVTDAENDPLFFELTSGPSWLSLEPTGKISGTPAATEEGLNSWAVEVWDGRSSPVQATLNLTVEVDTFPPSAPTGLFAVAGDASIGLVWEANTEQDFGTYSVYRSTSPNTIDTTVDTPIATGVSALTYGDSGLNNGTIYYYAITAVDVNGNESPASPEVSAVPDPNAGSDLSLSVYEPFDYAAGDLSGSASAGTGLSGVWTAVSGGFDVAAGSLTGPPNYGFIPTANSLFVSEDNYSTDSVGLSAENHIDFNDNRTFYISYLYRQNDPTHGRFNLMDGSAQIISVGNISNSTTLNATIGDVSARGSTLPNDTDMIIVARIETSTAGNDTIQASFFTDAVSQEPLVWDVEASSEITAIVDGVRFYNSTRAGEYVQFDELRLGTTFESVTQDGSSAPSAPLSVVATPSDSVVAIDWADNTEDDLASYAVYRSETSGTYTGTPLVVLDSTESNHIDDTAVNGTRYFYVVTASDADGNESIFSAEVGVIPAAFGNAPPAFSTDTIVEINGLETNAYTTTISGDATDPEADTLYFSKTDGPDWLMVAEDGALSGTPQPSDVGLNEFTVKVVAAGGNDTATLQITVDNIPDTTPPAAPSDLRASGGNGSVSLDWDDNSELDLATYRVFRSTVSGVFDDPAIGTDLTESAYVDESVVNGITYYYTIRALDMDGNESVPSDEVSATPSEISATSLAPVDNATAGRFYTDESQTLHLRNSAGFDKDEVAYLRFPINASAGTIGGIDTSALTMVSLKLSLAATAPSSDTIQVFLLQDLAQFDGSTESETSWTAANMTKESRPDGYRDLPNDLSGPVAATLTGYSGQAAGTELTIDLPLADFISWVDASSNDEVTIVLAGGTNVDTRIASLTNTNGYNAPTLVLTGAVMNPDVDADAIADSWEELYFGSTGVIDGSIDSDSDGVLDFFEYLYGSIPNDAASRGFTFEVGPKESEAGLAFEWDVKQGFVLGEDYEVWLSTNLSNWEPLPAGDFTLNQTDGEGLTHVELEITADYGDSVFLRLVKP